MCLGTLDSPPPPGGLAHANDVHPNGHVCDQNADLTGLELWPAARLLSGYLACYQLELAVALGSCESAIEIGSGCGLPGMSLCRGAVACSL